MQHPFVPTVEQRRLVEDLAGIGLNQDQIASLVINPRTNNGISKQTLHKFFSTELARGSAKATAAVAKNLFRIATAEDISSATTTACIFWMKCRAGWREVQRLEHVAIDGDLSSTAVDELRSRIDGLVSFRKEEDDYGPN